jgi:hypothetical protein
LSSWGKTADGRLVLLDYGFTDDVYQKHYKKSGVRRKDAGPKDVTAVPNGEPTPKTNKDNPVVGH